MAMDTPLTIQDIIWHPQMPQGISTPRIIMFENCNDVWFGSGGNNRFIYEAYAPYSEKLFGGAPYEEGQLSNFPLPEIYAAAQNFIQAATGDRGSAQALVDFMNWVSTFEKRIDMHPMEVLDRNILGSNENFYSITQFGKRPVDIATGQLIETPSLNFLPEEPGKIH